MSRLDEIRADHVDTPRPIVCDICWLLSQVDRLREAVEAEWYNGNMDEGARDRILGRRPRRPGGRR